MSSDTLRLRSPHHLGVSGQGLALLLPAKRCWSGLPLGNNRKIWTKHAGLLREVATEVDRVGVHPRGPFQCGPWPWGSIMLFLRYHWNNRPGKSRLCFRSFLTHFNQVSVPTTPLKRSCQGHRGPHVLVAQWCQVPFWDPMDCSPSRFLCP